MDKNLSQYMQHLSKLKTLHPIPIPSLIGSALIVSTDDHISTDILLVVTDTSLSWLLR